MIRSCVWLQRVFLVDVSERAARVCSAFLQTMGGSGKGAWSGKGWSSGGGGWTGGKGGWSSGGGGGGWSSGGGGWKGGKGSGSSADQGASWYQKGQGEWDASGEGQEPWQAEHAPGRLRHNYALVKAMLRPYVDEQGSAIVKRGAKTNGLSDTAYLGRKRFPACVTAENSHLVRQPGIGLSTAAGTLLHGQEVLERVQSDPHSLGFGGMAKLFSDHQELLSRVLSKLNTKASPGGKSSDYAEAFSELAQWLMDNKRELWDVASRATAASSRLYVMSSHLLQLLATVTRPVEWADKIPDAAMDHKAFSAWKKRPDNFEAMVAALGQFLKEKTETDAEYAGGNRASNVFGAKRERSSSSSGGGGKAKRRKSKAQARSASSSRGRGKAKKRSSRTKRARDRSSSSGGATQKRADKSGRGATPAAPRDAKEKRGKRGRKERSASSGSGSSADRKTAARVVKGPESKKVSRGKAPPARRSASQSSYSSSGAPADDTALIAAVADWSEMHAEEVDARCITLGDKIRTGVKVSSAEIRSVAALIPAAIASACGIVQPLEAAARLKRFSREPAEEALRHIQRAAAAALGVIKAQRTAGVTSGAAAAGATGVADAAGGGAVPASASGAGGAAGAAGASAEDVIFGAGAAGAVAPDAAIVGVDEGNRESPDAGGA